MKGNGVRRVKRFKKVFIILLLAFLLSIPAASSLALQSNQGFDFNPGLTDLFISDHEVIKAVPVYRALVLNLIHWYTTNEDVFYLWTSHQEINDDGIAAYISPVPLPYTVPMWNMVKNDMEQYFVTSEADRDYVIGKYGYQDCGIMGYVAPLDDTAHGNAQLFQWFSGNSDNFVTDIRDIFGVDNGWNADHYYNSFVYPIGGSYNYEGPRFRVWEDASVLQEIDVLSPNGGEALSGGSKVDIRWKTMIPGGNVSLYYTLNPPEGWSAIAENLENTGSFEWTVPNSAASRAVVEARWTYQGIDANCYDQSDQYFSIKTGVGPQINWALALQPLAMEAMLPPAAPSNLAAGANFMQTKPKLYWKDNSANETAFVIERKSSGAYAKLAQVAANQTQYADSSAEIGITYYYRVKAVHNQLSSGYSNEVAESVFTKPDVVLPAFETGKVNMVFTLNKSDYSVNGVTKKMDVSPVSINGRTLLPIRFAADPLGAETAWLNSERKVTVTLGATKLELWIGSNTARINGQNVMIDPDNPDVKPIILNSRTMLPMRFVTEKLGCGVEWIPADKQIKVTYPGN